MAAGSREVEKQCLILQLGLGRQLPDGKKTSCVPGLPGRRNMRHRPRPGKGPEDLMMTKFMWFPALPTSLTGLWCASNELITVLLKWISVKEMSLV